MTFKDYQLFTSTTAVYKETCPSHTLRMSYCGLGLTGEAGEVADKLKKVLRDGQYEPLAIAKELGDVLYYIAQLAELMGYSLQDIAEMNVAKLSKRMENNTIHGSGDDR